MRPATGAESMRPTNPHMRPTVHGPRTPWARIPLLCSGAVELPGPSYPDALVIMVKTPHPGQVKTRLQPLLSAAEAADLYRCFLLDLGRETGRWTRPCDRWIAWTGETSREPPHQLQEAFGEGFRWIEQRGESLSARMDFVFESLLQRGYHRVVMRNSDSPHLPPELLDRAFELLEPGAVVLGPDLDGGYYLIGADSPPGSLLPTTMSTSTVLDQTVEAARGAGRSVALLEEFLDVDTPDDLAVFWYEFGGRADVRHWATWQWLDGSDVPARLLADDP
jgi:rSAM/selenodomain-associated transferase 1